MPTVLTSGLNLDGEISLPPPHYPPSNEEEVVVDVGECVRDNEILFCEIYSMPPKRVKSSILKLGFGTFVEIDKDTGNYVYQFVNGELYNWNP